MLQCNRSDTVSGHSRYFMQKNVWGYVRCPNGSDKEKGTDMKEMIKKMREERGGFTLAGLLVVVAIVAVLSQQLLPRRDGMGRALACELMMVTPAIRNLIREGKTPQIAGSLATSASAGSVTMDNALIALARNRDITSQTAIDAAHDVDYVRKSVR